MDLKQLIKDYLKTPRTMQLASCVNNKPWSCTVHFYSDDDLNFYWMSTPARRHSKEIAENPNVSASILIHEDKPDEKYIVGLAVEGAAELLDKKETEEIGKLYAKKLGRDPKFVTDILEGRNLHQFYRLKSSSMALFDTKNFPDNPRQELII